jgi:hypothetical protein
MFKRLNLPENYASRSILVVIIVMLLVFHSAHLSAQSISQGGGGTDSGSISTPLNCLLAA